MYFSILTLLLHLKMLMVGFKLTTKGFEVKKQKALPLVYKEVKLEAGYGVDLLIENEVIAGIKRVIL